MIGYAFSWVFAYIGLISSSPEAANAFGFMFIFPLTFISSAFVPPESMPAVLETFAEVNPFTTFVDALRALWQGDACRYRRVGGVRLDDRDHDRVRADRDGEVPKHRRQVGLPR